eukprot:scaffold94267_cov32-Tisochrysis_lutea.AAC.5
MGQLQVARATTFIARMVAGVAENMLSEACEGRRHSVILLEHEAQRFRPTVASVATGACPQPTEQRPMWWGCGGT